MVTVLPKDVTEAKEEINDEESRKTYEEYWSSCIDSYVFRQGTKFKIPIEQLETPLETLNIRALEERGVNKCLHYFLEMPDPDKKMTLCAMPQGLKEKPQSFNDIKSCKFWMVNGQHSMEASKRMKNLFGTEKKFENLRNGSASLYRRRMTKSFAKFRHSITGLTTSRVICRHGRLPF